MGLKCLCVDAAYYYKSHVPWSVFLAHWLTVQKRLQWSRYCLRDYLCGPKERLRILDEMHWRHLVKSTERVRGWCDLISNYSDHFSSYYYIYISSASSNITRQYDRTESILRCRSSTTEKIRSTIFVCVYCGIATRKCLNNVVVCIVVILAYFMCVSEINSRVTGGIQCKENIHVLKIAQLIKLYC